MIFVKKKGKKEKKGKKGYGGHPGQSDSISSISKKKSNVFFMDLDFTNNSIEQLFNYT